MSALDHNFVFLKSVYFQLLPHHLADELIETGDWVKVDGDGGIVQGIKA